MCESISVQIATAVFTRLRKWGRGRPVQNPTVEGSLEITLDDVRPSAALPQRDSTLGWGRGGSSLACMGYSTGSRVVNKPRSPVQRAAGTASQSWRRRARAHAWARTSWRVLAELLMPAHAPARVSRNLRASTRGLAMVKGTREGRLGQRAAKFLAPRALGGRPRAGSAASAAKNLKLWGPAPWRLVEAGHVTRGGHVGSTISPNTRVNALSATIARVHADTRSADVSPSIGDRHTTVAVHAAGG